MTVLGLRGPPKVYDSHQEGYMLGHCVDYDSLSLNPFPLLNYHLHNCDAWLGVLLGAMQYLPVGLALHDYKASTGHVNGGRSSHRNEQGIHPHYCMHCICYLLFDGFCVFQYTKKLKYHLLILTLTTLDTVGDIPMKKYMANVMTLCFKRETCMWTKLKNHQHHHRRVYRIKIVS